ncbi:hypothetical protein WJX84_006291 [Apatococcus fuscideae]|uniref:Major facilitator superfamily (MFS) profile domain-containing protein n=1 Tax=Apatococcus fuscideae TaxID=2026836 RepID=A0AAW1T8F8_9CHLO
MRHEVRFSDFPGSLYAAIGTALLGSLQFGYHMGVTNTPLQFIAEDLRFSLERGSALVTSALLVGAAAGSLVAGQAADKYGPKHSLLLNNLLFVAGCVLTMTTPFGLTGMVAGRTAIGLACGAASLYVPRYVAEVAPPGIRGALSTCCQVMVTFGALLSYCVGWPYAAERAAFIKIGGLDVPWWRVMLGLGLLPAIGQMVGLAACPESPMWLDWVGRKPEAQKARQKLLGAAAEAIDSLDSLPADSEGLDEANLPLTERRSGSGSISGAEQVKDDQAGTWEDLLSMQYRRIMLLAAGLPLLQQASGINTVIYYSSQVFRDAGLRSPVAGSVAMGASNVIGTLLAAGLMDRLGRRPLLLFSHTCMAICLIAMSAAQFSPASMQVEGAITLSAILAYVFSFALGVGPVPWVYLPEILPDRIKGRAQAACTSLSWVANLMVGLSFPAMLSGLGIGGAYLFYVALNVAAVAFVATYMVETKQRSLANIKKELINS